MGYRPDKAEGRAQFLPLSLESWARQKPFVVYHKKETVLFIIVFQPISSGSRLHLLWPSMGIDRQFLKFG
jgi:hypothetical protein